LAFTDGKSSETYQYDSVLVSKTVLLWIIYIKDTVSQIKIDALPLPVITRDSINTALSYEDASAKLRVVFMKPMLEGSTLHHTGMKMF
jgi:hypothetical protein